VLSLARLPARRFNCLRLRARRSLSRANSSAAPDLMRRLGTGLTRASCSMPRLPCTPAEEDHAERACRQPAHLCAATETPACRRAGRRHRRRHVLEREHPPPVESSQRGWRGELPQIVNGCEGFLSSLDRLPRSFAIWRRSPSDIFARRSAY
jgi:hypothetical protein